MHKPMTVADADALGRRHGQDIAGEVIAAGVSVYDAGAVPYADALEDGVTAGELSDTFHGALAEAEDHFRQHSPFEFYAAAINARRDAESGWAAYDAGFERGVRVALRAAGLGALL